MGADWFRKESWSSADQEDFWQRLTRAREYNRAQYLFIQGFTLMEVGPQHTTAAITLFDAVIERYSQTISFVPVSYTHLATSKRWFAQALL